MLRIGLRDGLSILSGMVMGLILGVFLTLVSLGVLPVPSIFSPIAHASGLPSRTLPESPYRNEIQAAAVAAGINPNVLHAIVEIESGGDPYAESEVGAQGLAQLMPEIQAAFGVEDPFDPTQNLAGSAQFLGILTRKYSRLELAIAAYHAGEPLVDQCNCVPREVDVDYVTRFFKVYKPIQLPYRLEASLVSNGLHGKGMWVGRDFATECGTPLYAPITGEVSAAGIDGYTGPHGSNNTFMQITGTGEHSGLKVLLLHGEYRVKIGDSVIQGITRIGKEASIGNSTGCHTHITTRYRDQVIDPVLLIQ